MKKDIKDLKNGKQYLYILNSIDISEYCQYENVIEPTQNSERIQFILNVFNTEVNNEYEKHRLPNLQQRIANWLQGLPGVINIDYTYFDIVTIGNNWGVLHTEKQNNEYILKAKEHRFIENWFVVCALRILQLAKRYDIDISYLY